MKPFASSAILVLGTNLMIATAQQPGPLPPRTSTQASQYEQAVTTRSSLRAFSAGPDGAPRTLFLANGDAVELGPRFGGLSSSGLRKGERIEVTGASTKVANQRTIDASTVRIGSQTYMAMAATNDGPGLASPPAGSPPPPPLAGPGGPPPPPVAVGPTPPPPPRSTGPRGVALPPPPPPPPCAALQAPKGAAVTPPPAANAPMQPPPANGTVAPPPLPAGTIPPAAGTPPPQQP